MTFLSICTPPHSKAGELLLEVEIPSLPAGMTSAYLRLHRYQRPTLGVAVAARIDNDKIAEARLAVGCVGPKAQRLSRILEEKLGGVTLTDAGRIIAEEKKYLRDVLRPVDDLLGSAEYKIVYDRGDARRCVGGGRG